MSTELIRYDAACQALAKAKAVDEVKEIHDKAAAITEYARRAKNKDLFLDGGEIMLRARRRTGELLQDMAEAKQRQTRGITGGRRAKSSIATLHQLGITKTQSSKWQAFAAIPKRTFEAILAEWRERVSSENERLSLNLLREARRAERDSELKQPAWPEGKYAVIYADPPWQYDYTPTEGRAIENLYPTMTLEELGKLPVQDLATDDAIIFLWATPPKLEDSMQLLKAWGFTHKTNAAWDKEIIGMGYHFRQQHELLLVGTRGSPGTPPTETRVPSVYRERRGKHSAKPEYFAKLIERMYPKEPKIELFARTKRSGWDSWGNEADSL